MQPGMCRAPVEGIDRWNVFLFVFFFNLAAGTWLSWSGDHTVGNSEPALMENSS